MRDDPFESARLLRMRAAFDKAVQEGVRSENRNSVRGRLEERIERVTARAEAHVKKHLPIWVARENQKLVQKHRGQLKPSLSPKWVLQTETSPAALAQRAYQNVEQRIKARLKKIEQIGNHLQNRTSSVEINNRNKSGMNM